MRVFDRRPRRRAVPTFLALLAASCVVLTGCSAGASGPEVDTKPVAGPRAPASGVSDPASDPALQGYYRQKLTWSGCPSGGGMECARLQVPLDWSAPAGQKISIAVNRHQASGSSLGALVLNPGGPGVGGLSYARSAVVAYGKSLVEHFDIVGFDPRGTGESSAVQCLSNSQLDTTLAADTTPDDSLELASAVEDAKELGTACEQNTGALLEHVDTISVARDLDVLRAALGDDTLSFMGFSYGTFIGSWYAETFPWRVGRMVLDGAIDPSLTSAEYLAGQAEGFSRVLRAFVADCVSQSDCPLRGGADEALDELGELSKQLDTTPLSTGTSRPLTQSLMLTGISQALYNTQTWPALTSALTRAMSGDGSGLLTLADEYYRRGSGGKYAPDVVAANPAIFCLDNAEVRTSDQIQADAVKIGAEYPPLGEAIGWGGLTCSEWPVEAVVPHRALRAEGAPPILVVGTVDDPATPYEWAQALAGQLSSGRLLTWEGSVHTAYRQGGPCVDDAVETYLLNGDLPATGTRCS